MDPITAFSLACGVIQVVDFSAKVVVKCREIYKHGALSENREIEFMTKHLTDLFTELKSIHRVANPEPLSQLYHDDQDLQKLAQQCSETATKLIAELQDLSIQGQQRNRDVFRKAIKGVWKKSTIEGIQRRLEYYRRTLDTRILVNMRQRIHLISIDQSDGFKDLDRKIQNLIIGVARDNHTFDELRTLIQMENASSKQHFSEEFKKHRDQMAADDFYKRFLGSLYFPDIHARQEEIAEAHKQTFEWIFHKSSPQSYLWHNFADWLESGHGTYWICGKAGSGKSTLMNFVCRDSRTEAALKIWSGTNEILIPSFFFWNAGTELQKSSRGLLRSLIYQNLEKVPRLMPMLQSFPEVAGRITQQIPTWTEQRLHAALQHLLRNGLSQFRICVFIDGLDEFSNSQDDLLELIRDFRSYQGVKICLSSRPYQSFRKEYGSSAMLKLQDLTEPDMRKYVSDKLNQTLLKAPLVPGPSSRLDGTVETIIGKAEGVFLWVNLAVKDQIEGIKNGDDAAQLRERLELLPNEIEGLYDHMLQSIDRVYRKEVALYLQLALQISPRDGSPSLLKIALAVYNRVDDFILCSPDVSLSDINHQCELVGERIATTCKGFLETSRVADTSFSWWQRRLHQAEPLKGILENDTITAVNFLHRTAFDFFEENEQAKKFLEANLSVNQHPYVLYAKSLLARLMVLRGSIDVPQAQASIEYIMATARGAEEISGIAQPSLMELLDRSITMLWPHSPNNLSNIHWCRAWTYSKRVDDLPLPVSRTRHDFELRNGAWFGVYKYVEHTIESQSGRQNPNTADYLLSCAVGGLGNSVGDILWYLKLITALLKRGADPNKAIPGGSVWGLFLQNLHSWSSLDKILGKLSSDDSVLEDTGWSDTARTFLESGANVNKKICSKLGPKAFYYVAHIGKSITVELSQFDIGLDLSATSVFQQCFANSPKLSGIDGPYIAAGSSVYFECTAMSFKERSRGDYGWIDMNLSKQQLSQLSQVSDQLLRASREDRKERHRAFERQIENLFHEFDMQRLHEQAHLQDGEGYLRFFDHDLENSFHRREEILNEWSISFPNAHEPEAEEPSQPSPLLLR